MADINPTSSTPAPVTPNPQSAMMYFFFMTTIYCIFSVFMSSSDTSQKMITKACYVLFVIIGEYFINLNLSNSMCGINQWQSTFFITIVPWLLIFITLQLFLNVFPGWLAPFSNTFGYLGVKLMGLPDLMKDIIAQEAPNDPTGATKRAILSITSDDSLLINQFSPEKVVKRSNSDTGAIETVRPIFDQAWENLEKSGIIKTFDNPDKRDTTRDKLYEFVEMKYTFAEYIWNLLSGFLVTSISYNYIINIGCKKSAADMKKRHDAYEQAENEKIKANEKLKASQPNYTH